MTPQSIESLMADIEAEDPLDVGELAIDEHDARRLMANHFCEIDRRLAEHGLDTGARLEVMAAIAAHTMVENMVLQIGALRGGAERGDFRAWMRRHGLG
jgi:DNA-binding phage protein